MEHLRPVSFLMGLVLLYPGAVSSEVLRVRRGHPVVLQCEVNPGGTLPSVTWKLHLYNSSCVISYKTEEDNTKTSFSSCSPRMRSDKLSLMISNTDISDEGMYICEIPYDRDTIYRNYLLLVLVQPSTFLKLNSDGSPECGAIGGSPPAEISWIPDLDDINTTKLEDPDRTWSVISTFNSSGINETSVTCVVSHPTFVNPWKADITLSGYKLQIDNIVRLIVTLIITFLLFVRFLLYLKIKCQGENIP
ncbi:cell surface glycoprotein CD200 receptor 1-B-like [Anomaloglossus baeobatrachus]